MNEIIELGKPIELRFIDPNIKINSINIDEVHQFLTDSLTVDRDYFDAVTESLRFLPKEKIQTELVTY
jgi:hypothetical protein